MQIQGRFVLGVMLALSSILAHAAPFAYIPSPATPGTVRVIDTATNTVVGAPIPVGANPEGVAVNPAGTRIYTGNFGNAVGAGTVSVIDATTNTVVATVATGQSGTAGVAVTLPVLASMR